MTEQMGTCIRCGGKFPTRTSGIEPGVRLCNGPEQCDRNVLAGRTINSEYDDDLGELAEQTLMNLIRYRATDWSSRNPVREQDTDYLARQFQRVRDGRMEETR
jgi:hypothetical protein